MIPTKPEPSDANPSSTLANIGNFAGVTLCIVAFVFVQLQLLYDTTPVPQGGIGKALLVWVLKGRPPQGPSGIWYQVPAPIAKERMKELPANVAQRAGPVVDWLTRSGGLQRGQNARFLLDEGGLTIDIYDIDEVGCRRIMEASRLPPAPIDLIAATATAADMVPVPTNVPDEKQCGKGTNFMRMISRSRALPQ